MKYLKEFWSTQTTDDNVDFSYDEDNNISEFVKNVIDFINDNYHNISKFEEDDIRYYRINFNEKINDEYEFKVIMLDNYKEIKYYIYFKGDKWNKVFITEYEYNYLCDFFKEIFKRFVFDKEDRRDIIDDKINPIKRSAKKYNI